MKLIFGTITLAAIGLAQAPPPCPPTCPKTGLTKEKKAPVKIVKNTVTSPAKTAR